MTIEAGPDEKFQDFLRSFQTSTGENRYRRKLAQMAVTSSRSLTIDFEDLLTFDPPLAKELVEKPDAYLIYANKAVWAQMKIEDPEYAEQTKAFFARFRRFPDKTQMRKIGSGQMGRLVVVDGIIVRSTPVKPMITRAAFRCRRCENIVMIDQTGFLMRGVGICPSCRSAEASFELLIDRSAFMDFQEMRIQERPEDLPPGQLPRSIDVRLIEDLVDIARPGDRVSVTGVVRAQQEMIGGRGRLRTFDMFLDANYLDVTGKEAEVVEITPEEEKTIKELASDPWIHQKLLKSLAPSIYGYDDIKEAILYLLFGGVPKHLPDGISIRGDVNALLVGDPGCLVGDERIVLGNGAIVRLDQLGKEHLENISVQVLTGEGGAKRDTATRFHIYRNQPILEAVTESGKSIKGTYNHPLLVVAKEDGRPVRYWKRLDEIEIGDRLAVATGFPCTIREYVRTGFVTQPRRLGPKFKGKLPSRLTPELAAMLGYLTGDGWVQRYRVGLQVVEDERDLLPILCRIADRQFGMRLATTKRKRADRRKLIYECMLHSEDIASNLSFLREKRIPGLVLRSGNDVAASYLRWLFEADGSVFDKGRGSRAITLKAKNIELLRDTQILLLRFGIHSRIISDTLLIRRGNDIIKFAKSIGFASEKKCARLARLVASAEKFGRVHRQRSERVVRIVRHAPQDVYDIEVPGSHRFIANGLISHNTAKSQMLQYVARIAPRGLYTSGRGTTAAGLTAAVLREKTGGMVLEAGALVLADKGVAAIDEIDKMRPDDRVAIHEAMEQHTVSVAKGGIVATLNARASVLAAANPALGRYDPYRNITENINLPVTILSRFDLLFVMKDIPEADLDSKMSDHILTLHRTKTTPEESPIPPDLFRKYVSYSKKFEPSMGEEATGELRDFYLKMRSSSSGAESPIAITPRQLEALVRLSEARARAFLRPMVSVEDARAAIRLMTVSLQDVGIDTTTGKVDIDVIMTGKPKSVRDKMAFIMDCIVQMEKETGVVEEKALYEALSKKIEISEEEARRIVGQLIREGVLYSPKVGTIRRTSA